MGRSKKILALLLAVALLLTGMPMDILLAKGETKSTTKEGQELKKSSSSKSINVTDEQTKEKATSPAILPGATDPKKEEKSSQTIIDTAPKAEEKKSNVELVDDTPEAIEKVQTKDDATDKVDEASQTTQAKEAKESEKAEEVYKGENLNAYLSADNYKFEAKKDDQGGESLTDYIMSFSFKTEDFIKAGDYITVVAGAAFVATKKRD